MIDIGITLNYKLDRSNDIRLMAHTSTAGLVYDQAALTNFLLLEVLQELRGINATLKEPEAL